MSEANTEDDQRYAASEKEDPEYLECIAQAQSTFLFFIEKYEQYKISPGIFFGVKVSYKNGDSDIPLWCTFRGYDEEFIICEPIEIPKGMEGAKTLKVAKNQIEDWMINDRGFLYGGFTIRLQRSKITEEMREEFDDHIGVDVYKVIDFITGEDLTE